MSDRWYIFKEGKQLGPMSSAEIREGLRDGTLDPFDLVARDGSSVRRELVEVDEIFANSQVVYVEQEAAAAEGGAAAGGGEVAGRHAVTVDAGAGGFVPLALVSGGSEADSTQVSGRAVGVGFGHLALADDSTANRSPGDAQPQQAAPRRRRKDPKRYSLVDTKGRVLGPMSASEIQALFYKGVLDKSVVVLRHGSTARVPVTKFVAVYSESKRQKAPQQAAHPAMAAAAPRPAGQRTMLQLAAAYQRRLLDNQQAVMIAVLIAGFIVVAMAGWVLLRKTDFSFEWPSDDEPTEPVQVKPPRDYRPLKEAPQTKPPRKTQPDKVKPAPKQPERKPRLESPRKSRAEQLRQERERQRQREIRERRERLREQPVKKPRPQSTIAVTPRPRPPTKLPPAKPLPQPAPPPKALPAPQPAPPKALPAPQPAAPPKAAAPQGASVASLQDGQTVSNLGPMTFDRAALQACSGSCSLTFSGAGGSVQVSFFKQAWGAQLASKSGGVYLSGIVRKRGGQTRLILQGVR